MFGNDKITEKHFSVEFKYQINSESLSKYENNDIYLIFFTTNKKINLLIHYDIILS